MNKTRMAAALAMAIGAGTSSAGAFEDELAAIKARLSALEAQVSDQNRVIAEKDREIAELREAQNSGGGGGDAWFNRVEVGGLVEVEAAHVSSDNASDVDDLVASKIELGIAAQINPWVAGEIVLKFEEDTDNSDGTNSDVDLDTAVITIADPDSSWFVNAGQYTLPFGTFPSYQVSDPLTLDVAETLDTAVEAGAGVGPATLSVFVFDGDRSATSTDRYGAALALETEAAGAKLAAQIAYMNDVGETNGLGEIIANGGGFTTSDRVPGYIAGAEIGVGAFLFIAEYFQATDDFADLGGDKPSAYNAEAAYVFETVGRPSTFAVAMGGTGGLRNADDGNGNLGLFVERRRSATYAVEVLDGTTVALEYKSEEDYNGTDTDTVTGQLAVEF
ncbi:MAG: LbtU family siderophore porin [Gammaproteobacteria bacterium]|nr:LbtU family siderophore porin [Gammaproteobacteria bacterium]